MSYISVCECYFNFSLCHKVGRGCCRSHAAVFSLLFLDVFLVQDFNFPHGLFSCAWLMMKEDVRSYCFLQKKNDFEQLSTIDLWSDRDFESWNHFFWIMIWKRKCRSIRRNHLSFSVSFLCLFLFIPIFISCVASAAITYVNKRYLNTVCDGRVWCACIHTLYNKISKQRKIRKSGLCFARMFITSFPSAWHV